MKNLMRTLCVVSVSLMACSNSDDGESVTNYTGPGSFWTANLSASSFVMERAPNYGDPIDLTVTGSISTLASGYKEFTVATAIGTNPPPAGEKAYGFEIPGLMTLVKPLNSVDDKLLPMLASGSCPSTDVDFNWIVTGYNGGSNIETTADIVGVANYTLSNGNFNITAQHSLDGTDVTSAMAMPSACSNGFAQIDTNPGTPGPEVDMWLTASGSGMIHTDDGTVIVAMPAESFSAASLSSKNFIGLVFNENNSTKVEPIHVDVAAGGASATAGVWADVVGNVKGNAQGQINFTAFDSPQVGFVQATLDIDTNNDGSFDATGGNLVCQYKGNIVNSGRDILFCAGHTPAAVGFTGSEMFNILLVSQ